MLLYARWFIPLSIIVICLFVVALLILTLATLLIRRKVIKVYDPRRETNH